VDEGLTALEEALRTGLPSWISFTPGFRGDLLTPDEMRQAARRAAAMGAAAVLVNCVPVERGVEYVDALAAGCAGRIPIGICANVWSEHSERTGGTRSRVEPERYADFAAEWSTRGATIVGGCCGTGSAHIAALAARFCA
jgi:S-methylmethionine-dependent homocysteine/selenocysteine methylase